MICQAYDTIDNPYKFIAIYAETLQEKTGYLNIYTGQPIVIYSVPVENLQKDNIIQISTTFEATNQFLYNVMIGSQLYLSDSDNAVTGVPMEPASAFNISPNMHHGVIVRSRNYKVTQDLPGKKYVNLVAWAQSVNASTEDKLRIEHHYGHLDIVIF